MTQFEPVWIPNKSVGGIQFNEKIQLYIDQFNLYRVEEKTGNEIEVYYKSTGGEFIVDTEDSRVFSVSSYNKILFKGHNIVGISSDELLDKLGIVPDEIGEGVLFDNGEIQTPWEFFSLGLQIWLSRDTVVLASCLNYDTP